MDVKEVNTGITTKEALHNFMERCHNLEGECILYKNQIEYFKDLATKNIQVIEQLREECKNLKEEAQVVLKSFFYGETVSLDKSLFEKT